MSKTSKRLARLYHTKGVGSPFRLDHATATAMGVPLGTGRDFSEQEALALDKLALELLAEDLYFTYLYDAGKGEKQAILNHKDTTVVLTIDAREIDRLIDSGASVEDIVNTVKEWMYTEIALKEQRARAKAGHKPH